MFDISWSHLMMFGIAAIVLVPSKDLPKVLRTAGRYWGDAQRMARDFRSQISDAIRETELTDIRDSVSKELKDIEKSASVSAESQAFNAAITSAAATAGSQPQSAMTSVAPMPVASTSGQVVPKAETAPAIIEADAANFGSGATVPMTPLRVEAPAAAGASESEPARASSNPSAMDGIDIVRPGKGSVAQRAARAWKKSPAGGETGA